MRTDPWVSVVASSRPAIGLLLLLLLLGATGGLAAQQWHADLGVGPTLRVPGGGSGLQAHLFDSWTLTAAVERQVRDGFGVRLHGGLTVGSVTEAIPLGIPCPLNTPCLSTGTIEVPGAIAQLGVTAVWGAGRFRVGAGPALYTATDAGTTAGVHGMAGYRLLGWLEAETAVARFASELGSIGWLVSPSLKICLRHC